MKGKLQSKIRRFKTILKSVLVCLQKQYMFNTYNSENKMTEMISGRHYHRTAAGGLDLGDGTCYNAASILIHGIYSLFQRFQMKKSPVTENSFLIRATTIRAENIMLFPNYHRKAFCLKMLDQ